jgi:hypothetical protein
LNHLSSLVLVKKHLDKLIPSKLLNPLLSKHYSSPNPTNFKSIFDQCNNLPNYSNISHKSIQCENLDLEEQKKIPVIKDCKNRRVIDKLKCQINSKNDQKRDSSSGRIREDSDIDEIEMPVVRNETEHRQPLIRIQEPLNPHLMNALPGLLNNNLNRANLNNNFNNNLVGRREGAF